MNRTITLFFLLITICLIILLTATTHAQYDPYAYPTPEPHCPPYAPHCILGWPNPTLTPQPLPAAPPPVDDTWPGYSDGRLNPDPGEYYSLWCIEGELQIYIADGTLVGFVPRTYFENMQPGDVLELPNFISVVYNDETTITVYGSNGNRAPAPGEKAFNPAECHEN